MDGNPSTLSSIVERSNPKCNKIAAVFERKPYLWSDAYAAMRIVSNTVAACDIARNELAGK
jgi:hypothetical protein